MIKLATRPDGQLRKFFTSQQLAEAAKLDVRTIRAMIDRREITAVMLAGKVRIPEEDYERLLQQARIGRPFRPQTHPRDQEEEE